MQYNATVEKHWLIDCKSFDLKNEAMKYLFFTAVIMLSTFSQAYLVKGVRTTVLIDGNVGMEDVSIEGCDKESCSKPDYKAKCTKDDPSKFYCYLKDQYPFFIRFTVRINGNKVLSSKFFATNGETSLDNFKLNINEKAVTAKTIKDVL